jgi:hypothetical protein
VPPVCLLCLAGLGMVAEVWHELPQSFRTIAGLLLALSFFIQLASLTLKTPLEFEQQETYGHPMTVVGQRFRNIAGYFTGELEEQAARYHWDAARLSFAPFAIEDSLSRGASRVVILGWLLGILLDGVLLAMVLRSLPRPILRNPTT